MTLVNKPLNKKYPSVREVSDTERINMVKEMFATITRKYDFLNHLLSLRRDVAWRRFTVKKMRFFNTSRLLDVACGTADLAIDAARRLSGINIIGIDFVYEMLDAGRDKVERKGLSRRITLMQSDAMELPFCDNAFDVVAVAFGVRNMPNREKALKEMLRVTAPGGSVMVLEMTFIQNRIFKIIYHIYLNYLLPRLAKHFSPNPAAYHYLADSIMNFPNPDAFATMMEATGMVDVKKYPLTFGITYLHTGTKPGA
ncbi:MAG: bifunctional demethylmenaquinone methyltransferase/2-methoxy-6-polyprenyl-1,4-benzoquinol methylase UbiE [Syntrophorhabdaceae bacterium]|nr:bifunctional demethylmenaquinone methyltransferase/2-methoxy-6-polyprenyl-1,4-benzoquinol methylase UbiE [Syntrophorhabdaceae bacterium]MDD4196924.1 bifunctional demethylmenaquinone methyltransferase/2-methoxy-6-polyprenyl-1,4-benzoquinol methylase UbiE [Syntrophorhabdaceae bacterium]